MNIFLLGSIVNSTPFWVSIIIILIIVGSLIIILSLWIIHAFEIIKRHTAITTKGEQQPLKIVISARLKHTNVEFRNINDQIVFPFGLRNMQLSLFCELIISKNKFQIQQKLDLIINGSNKQPKINIPILIRYKSKLYFYHIFFHYFDYSEKQLHGMLLPHNLSVIYDSIVNEYKYFSLNIDDELTKGLKCINSQKEKSEPRSLPSVIRSLFTKNTTTQKYKQLGIRTNRKHTKTTKNLLIHKKNILLLCFNLENLMFDTEHLHEISQNFFTSENNIPSYIKDCIHHLFGKALLCKITIPTHRHLLVFVIQNTKLSSSNELLTKFLVFQKMIRLKRLFSQQTSGFLDNSDRAKIKIQYCSLAVIPRRFSIGKFVISRVYPRLGEKNEHSKFTIEFYTRRQIFKYQRQFQLAIQKENKQLQKTLIMCSTQGVYNFQKKIFVGKIVMVQNRKTLPSSTSFEQLEQQKSLIQLLINQINNFEQLVERVGINLYFNKPKSEKFFFVLELQLFLSYSIQWCRLFTLHKNVVVCFSHLSSPFECFVEATKICETNKLNFGIFNYSLIDPKTIVIAVRNKYLKYFFVNEKCVNFMLKYHKYFIPGIINMNVLEQKQTQIIFPLRGNQFYLYKFCKENCKLFRCITTSASLNKHERQNIVHERIVTMNTFLTKQQIYVKNR